MELWVFDRSGPYRSGEFDIDEELNKFILSLAGYAFMSDEKLGLDTFISRRGTKRTITLMNDVSGKKRKLQLDPEPFVKQRAIVCQGTTVFRTTDHANVVKFSWTSDKRPPEADHLGLAHEKGVEGIARLVGYQGITSIADLRSGLTFDKPWMICGSAGAEITSSRSLLSQSLWPLQVNTPEEVERSTSANSLSGSLARKRGSVDESGTTRKGRRVSNQVSSLRQEVKAGSYADSPASASLYQPSRDLYDNRLFGCLAISPTGCPLISFTTLLELLTALRDAIRAHRSLYLVGKILHRDISENNIIITDPLCAHGFSGMLIDLDMARQLDSGKSGARHQTGTTEFMAIEVLRNVAHTFRHDLESFFYVLLWLCGRRAWERGFLCDPKSRPADYIFPQWYRGSFKEIAHSKLGCMSANGFNELLDQFPLSFACVKPLCNSLRRILFLISAEGWLDISTPPEPGLNFV